MYSSQQNTTYLLNQYVEESISNNKLNILSHLMLIDLFFKSENTYYLDQAVFQIPGKEQCPDFAPQGVQGPLRELDEGHTAWPVPHDEGQDRARGDLRTSRDQPWETRGAGESR